MSEVKLLPCPFCGGEARISVDTDAISDSKGRTWAFTVVCESCCATSGLCYSTDMAVDAWNTRKPMNDIVEQLEEERSIFNNPDWNVAMNKAIKIVKGGTE